jgi:glycosyltransferase involved in cell wall biosynthesis
MRVLYFTYPWFLDFSIEYIKELSKKTELHVIVLCPENRNSATIFKLEEKVSYQKNKFYSLNDLAGNLKSIDVYKEYTKDCASFSFSFGPKKWLSTSSFSYNYQIYKYIQKLQVDIIHFDDLSIDLLWMSWFIRNKKILVNVHDPIAHTGEVNRRRKIIRKVYYPKVNKFITFSKYSAQAFFESYGYRSETLSLTPYNFYKSYETKKTSIENYFLFFGRVSEYKGIEDLIKAFIVLKEKYNVNLIIAGKNAYNYAIPEEYLNIAGITIYNKFIENDEMASLIKNCIAVVCPYKDATQSGVVMTSFAFEKQVVTSRVGGLYEPINEHNGKVYDRTKVGALEKVLIEILEEENKETVHVVKESNKALYNVEKLKLIYEILQK